VDSLSPRRQGGGSGSARSLLLTILGEFVLPADEPPWTSALLHVAWGLGLEEKSARQALARLAAGGWITAHRAGRRVRWALTPPGERRASTPSAVTRRPGTAAGWCCW
jgi:phenylacetic acid degradation operon negative regulatory protein